MSMKTPTIHLVSENWQSYARDVIDPGAGNAQINETRAAFFGGAWAAWQAMAEISHKCDGNEAVAKQLTEQLYNDISAGCHVALEGLGGV